MTSTRNLFKCEYGEDADLFLCERNRALVIRTNMQFAAVAFTPATMRELSKRLAELADEYERKE